LLKIDPEIAHGMTMWGLELAQDLGLTSVTQKLLNYEDKSLEMELFGLRFKNPLGLSAGFDKNARLVRIMPALGFGFIEIGTVTGRAQFGNPKPRMFRLPKDYALINRLGFNSEGADAVSKRLKKLDKTTTPLGINIGKTEVANIENAERDYLYSFERLFPFGDYFVVNVSCPNTPQLQSLQDREPLEKLLKALNEKNRRLSIEGNVRRKPIMVKICPDRSPSQIDDVIEVVRNEKIDGIIATNTTSNQKGLKTKNIAKEWGGLSGRPLTRISTEIIKYIYRRTEGLVPIIGVGGIFNADDAYEKIKAGASLVQIYTGMVYEGPSMMRSVKRKLLKYLERDKCESLRDAVGKSV
jgi:dihydroorotate dehydrogenase